MRVAPGRALVAAQLARVEPVCELGDAERLCRYGIYISRGGVVVVGIDAEGVDGSVVVLVFCTVGVFVVGAEVAAAVLVGPARAVFLFLAARFSGDIAV